MTLALTAALLLVGIVMVTSASMSIAAKEFTDPFLFPASGQFHLRALPARGIGLGHDALSHRACGTSTAWCCWLMALLLLVLVLIPGFGRTRQRCAPLAAHRNL